MSNKVKRTMVSQQAMEMSQLLTLRFARQVVGAEVPKRLMVQEPDGPSTGGGKMARQSIVLAPNDGSAAGTIMVGWLDIAQKAAELRMHGVVAAHHAERYGKTLDVAQEQYDALMTDVVTMLSSQAFHTNIVDVDADGSAPVSAPRTTRTTAVPEEQKSGGVMWVAVALAIAALGGIAAFLFLG